jgi:hypothetical protein
MRGEFARGRGDEDRQIGVDALALGPTNPNSTLFGHFWAEAFWLRTPPEKCSRVQIVC